MTDSAKQLADSLKADRDAAATAIVRLADRVAGLDGPQADMAWRLLTMAQHAIDTISFRDLMEIAIRNENQS